MRPQTSLVGVLDCIVTLKLRHIYIYPHISTDDAIGRTCKDEYELAMRSLGAVVWYLQFCYLDHDVLSLRSFCEYTPLDGSDITIQFDGTAAGEDGQLMSFQHSRMVSEL